MPRSSSKKKNRKEKEKNRKKLKHFNKVKNQCAGKVNPADMKLKYEMMIKRET